MTNVETQPASNRPRRFRIGCAVAIAIVVALLAVAVIFGRKALTRPTQKHSMADLATIGTAASSYATDHGQYPAATSLQELQSLLEGTYVKTFPREDAWGNRYRYDCWKQNPASKGCDAYAIVSSGADGRFQYASGRQYRAGPTTNADDDIVYGRTKLPPSEAEAVSSGFVQYPAGTRPRD